MTEKQIQQMEVFEKLIRKEIKQDRAGEVLNLSRWYFYKYFFAN